MKDARLYLVHILECIDAIERFTVGGRDEFFESELVQNAVLRQLQIMSESTQRLPEELKSKHNDVNWKQIAGFRNILVHDYIGVDIERCWLVIETELKPLKLAVKAMLQESDPK